MRCCPWFVACLLCTLIRAQGEVPAPSEFPFEFREGLLWVKASLPHSTESLNLLLDTGAAVSVLNDKTAERLGLKPGRAVSVRGVESVLTGHWLGKVSLTAAGLELPGDYLAIDLEQLSRSCETRVDGLIGADFFRGRAVQIDFDRQTVRILPPGRATIPGEALPLELRPCGMRVRLSVNGTKCQWVRLDTGCASALQWVTSNVSADECRRKVAIGLTAVSIPQTITTVQLGTQTFQNVPTGLHEQPIFEGEAGLLGNGLISRFSKVTIDAYSGRVVLESRPATP